MFLYMERENFRLNSVCKGFMVEVPPFYCMRLYDNLIVYWIFRQQDLQFLFQLIGRAHEGKVHQKEHERKRHERQYGDEINWNEDEHSEKPHSHNALDGGEPVGFRDFCGCYGREGIVGRTEA